MCRAGRRGRRPSPSVECRETIARIRSGRTSRAARPSSARHLCENARHERGGNASKEHRLRLPVRPERVAKRTAPPRILADADRRRCLRTLRLQFEREVGPKVGCLTNGEPIEAVLCCPLQPLHSAGRRGAFAHWPQKKGSLKSMVALPPVFLPCAVVTVFDIWTGIKLDVEVNSRVPSNHA